MKIQYVTILMCVNDYEIKWPLFRNERRNVFSMK